MIRESPKFLLTVHRNEEAFEIMESLLRDKKYLLTSIMKKDIINQYEEFMNNNKDRSNYKDLFNAKNLNKTLLLFVLWYISSYIYYGLIYILPTVYQNLTLNKNKTKIVSKNLYNDIIGDVIMSCIFEFPSNFANGILPNLPLLGRRGTIAIGFLGAYISLMLCCLNPIAIPLFSSIAKAFINTAFNVLYIYTVESYPTYMRATGLGVCNFFARVGGFTTPFLNELLYKINFIIPFILFTISSFIGLVITAILPFDTLGKNSF